jgi:hypothetical protein
MKPALPVSDILDVISLYNLAQLWGFEIARIKGGSIIMKRLIDNTEWHGQPQSCERWTAAFKRWSGPQILTYNGLSIPDAQS